MKKIALAALISLFAVQLFGAPGDCTLCGGIVTDLSAAPAVPVPALARVPFEHLQEAAERLSAFSPEQKALTTLLIRVRIEDASEALPQVEQAIAGIVDWARANGPFAALGVTLPDASPEVEAYAIKRLAVTTQGLGLARQIAYGPASTDHLSRLFENGAQAYFDELLVEGDVAEAQRWLADNDPAKRIIAIGPAEHPNPLYDIALLLAAGAQRAYVSAPQAERAIAALDRELAGEYTFDPGLTLQILDARGAVRSDRALAFVRGEDLRTLVFAPGDPAASTIVSVRGNEFNNPIRLDAAGSRPIRDSGKKGGFTLVGIPPGNSGFAITLDRPKIADPSVTREAIDVVTQRGITVEEIIRNHQSYRAFQDSIQPRFIARNETSLRFALGPGGDAFEATIAGEYFFDPVGRSDWVWQDFLVNGVKWKYGRMPEIPILQPERVTQVPLDLHLTKDYRYELVRSTPVRGFSTYEVRFEPPPNATKDLPLYRGTVWIDARTWARVRTSTLQLNLKTEVLSNEERIDFYPYDRVTKQPLSTEEAAERAPSALIWLPVDVGAQQTFSVAGATLPVIRATRLLNVQIDPEDFDARLEKANQSNARMVRDTDGGLKYLEKNAQGERVVKGIDTSRVFLLGGLYRDEGLEFGVVPLGGIDYFNYNLKNTGLQSNVFFAGVLVAANLTNPTYRGTRTNLGADFFGIAVPFENTAYRDGEEVEGEAVRTLPFNLGLRAGHPFLTFAKIDALLGLGYISYQQAETTAEGFAIPENTFEIRPGVDVRYDRRGYSLTAGYEYGFRTNWEPWGNFAEYSQDQEQFSRYRASIGKSFYLPKFQRLGIEFNYVDGNNLDRFSKYELGNFGVQRVRGIRSGSIRAERAILGHLSYGFVLTEQFRLEAFYDHALIDDTTAGFSREPFQGIGIAGQTVGPWGTILRLDIGKSVGRNAQDEFVANVVFLKLFG